MSSVPRRRRCPHGQATSLTAACHISAACPCLLGITTRPEESQFRGISRASLAFTPCPASDLRKLPVRKGRAVHEAVDLPSEKSLLIWPHSRRFFVVEHLWMKNLDV